MLTKMKKLNIVFRTFAVVLSIVTIMLAVAPITAADGDDSPEEYNIILLLDNTGSMNINDSTRISIDAAKNFIELLFIARNFQQLSSQKVPAIKVGVYTFSNIATEICPLTDISNSDSVAYMTDRISAIEYRQAGTGATYYGPALEAAYSALPIDKAGCKNLVFMFTDGKPEGGDYNSPQNSPENAITLLSSGGVEVMMLGLDARQRIDDDAKQLIYRIANSTQLNEGICSRESNDRSANNFNQVNYYIANKAGSELTSFLASVVGKMISRPNPILNQEIVVDKRAIVLVNIFKIDSGSLESGDIGLSFDGRNVDLEEVANYPEIDKRTDFIDNTFTILYSGRSAFLAMYAPTLGTYKLHLPTDVELDVRFVEIDVNREYTIDLEFQNNEQIPNECTCIVTVLENGEPAGDLGDLVVINAIGEDSAHTGTASLGKLEYDGTNGQYKAVFTAALPGEYRITASVEDVYRIENSKISIEKTIAFESNQPPKNETNITLEVNKDQYFAFPTEYYPKWPGVKYTSSIKNQNPDIIGLTENKDGSYVIHGNSVGEGQIVQKLTDEFGNEHVLTYHVKVTPNLLPIFLIVGGALAVLCVLGFIAMNKLTRALPGLFTIEYKGQRYAEIRPPRGTSFSVLDVCNQDADFRDLKDVPEDLIKKLKQEKICMKRIVVTEEDEDGARYPRKVRTYFSKSEKRDLNNDPLCIEYEERDDQPRDFTLEYSEE